MFDISGLDLKPLAPEDQVDYTKPYEAGGEYQAPPDEGRYLLCTTFKPHKREDRIFSADVVATIVSTDKGEKVGVGYRVFSGNQSIKKYPNSNASPLGNILAAHGVKFDTPPAVEDFARALTAVEGRIAVAATLWEWFCKDCDEVYKGQDIAPINPDGKRSFRKPCPHCRKELLANLRIKRWVSALTEAKA
mgnify:CR=1 FL=1